MEDCPNLPQLLRDFNEASPNWAKTRCILVSKEVAADCQFLKREFPKARLVSCNFAALQDFRRGITCLKTGIPASLREEYVEILRNMLNARNKFEYDTFLKQFENVVPAEDKEYLNSNWRNIHNEWALCPSFRRANLFRRVSNVVELFKSRFKLVAGQS